MPADLWACTVEIDEVYDQTPGPGAGGRHRAHDRRRRAPARGPRPVLRGRHPRRARHRVGRRRPERHLPVEGPRPRRRAHRPLQPVPLEVGEEPGREPPGLAAADRAGHPRRVPPRHRLRAHRAARPGVRRPQGRRRRHRRLHRHAGRVPPPRRRHLPGHPNRAGAAQRAGRRHRRQRRRWRRRRRAAGPDAAALGELCGRISRCADLDTLVRVTVDGLAELLGHEHSMLLLLDEDGRRLFTLASRGYERRGRRLGGRRRRRRHRPRRRAGGAGAGRQRPPDRQVRALGPRSPTRSPAPSGRAGRSPCRACPSPTAASPCPCSPSASSSACSPSRPSPSAHYVAGRRVGASVVAALVATAIETIRAEERVATATAAASPAGGARPVAGRRDAPTSGSSPSTAARSSTATTSSRASPAGCCGRCCASTTARAAPSSPTARCASTRRLDLPDFRDNFESRLILLKRRLDERDAPIRIEKTGRGQFRLVTVSTGLRLEEGAG